MSLRGIMFCKYRSNLSSQNSVVLILAVNMNKSAALSRYINQCSAFYEYSINPLNTKEEINITVDRKNEVLTEPKNTIHAFWVTSLSHRRSPPSKFYGRGFLKAVPTRLQSKTETSSFSKATCANLGPTLFCLYWIVQNWPREVWIVQYTCAFLLLSQSQHSCLSAVGHHDNRTLFSRLY